MEKKMRMPYWILFVFTLILVPSLVHASFNTILDANFNDGSLDGWDVNSGTWSAANFDLNGAFLDGGSISKSVLFPPGSDFQIHYNAKLTAASLNSEFFFFTDQNGAGNSNGYEFLLQSATTLFRKRVNGTPTTLITSSAVSLNTFHTIDINKVGPFYSIFVDGNSIGSVTDTTYLGGSKIFFSTENTSSASAFDNILIRSNAGTNYSTITILRPIDEKTLVPFDGNWIAQLIDTNSASFQNANNSQKVFIGIKDNNLTNDFIISDSNSATSLYFPRTYSIKIGLNDANTYTLQPYLVKQTDGSIVGFVIYDRLTNITVSNLLVSSMKGVGINPNTLVEQQKSSANGSTAFSFQNGQFYNITVSDINGQTIYFPTNGQSNSFQNTFNIYYIYIQKSTNTVTTTAFDWNIFVAPAAPVFVAQPNQVFDINAITNYAQSITVGIYDGNTLLASSTQAGNSLNFETTLDTNGRTSGFITILIDMFDGTRTYRYSNIHRIVLNQSSLLNSLTNVSSNVGLFGGLVITLCMILLALQNFGPGLNGNNESQVFLVGLILVMGGFLFFFPSNAQIIVAALVFGGVVWLVTRS